MAEGRGVVFEVAYPCPHCRADLAGKAKAADWLRCPMCGRGSQAPDDDRTTPARPLAADDPRVKS